MGLTHATTNWPMAPMQLIETRVVDQRFAVTRWERVLAGIGVGAGVIDFEDGAGGLLLKPLADVALAQPARVGEVAGGRRSPLGQRPVEA
jgi:hypothetical protein